MAALMILIVSMVALAGADSAVDPHFTPRPAYVNANKAPVDPVPSAATILSIPVSVVATSDDPADDAKSAAGVMNKIVAKVVEKVIDVVTDVREKVADAVSDFVDDAKAGSSSRDHDDVVFKNNDNSNETKTDDSEETDTLNDNSDELDDGDSAEKSKSSTNDNSKDDDKKIKDDGNSKDDDKKINEDDNSKDDDKKINDDNSEDDDKKINNYDNSKDDDKNINDDDNSKDADKKINDNGNDSKNREKSSTEVGDKQKDNSKERITGKNKVHERDDSGERRRQDKKDDNNTSNDKNKDEESSEKADGKSVWSFLKDLTGDIENESADDDTKVRHYLTRISKFRGYMDAMDSNFAVSLAKQSGTCPVYPIQVGNNRVTITTENGCKIIIKLKGLTVDKIEDGHEEKKRAHKRSILVSYSDN
ncbi:unnamed protein product [Candidula unifasciata]|uniref:Shell matrix protein n=1 Tax=Candidula unifasciata TaxID=100452 RepID=A0A8S3YTA9_9EUPU|nr:unnamed protein product [Candidula unifasciata]